MKPLYGFALGAAIIALLAFVPMFASGYQLALGISLLYFTVLATAWAMFSGPTHYISLATVAFFGIGAYTVAVAGEFMPWPAVLAMAGLIGNGRMRLAFLGGLESGWPDVSDEGLLTERATWLWPLLESVQSLDAIPDAALETGLKALVPWDRQRALEDLAPARLQTPLGSASIDYAAHGGPRVDIRVQELFGLTVHPMVGGGRVPLTLALLSPARRPVQVTKDLPGFWKGSWAAVRAEMRGRYPRHPWPENPAEAAPTNRVKPRGT